MAEITEIFDDVGTNVKKTFKNKKFWIAAAVVGGVALVMAYIKKRGESNDGYYTTADGYTGYPSVTGASEDSGYLGGYDDDYISSIIGQIQTENDNNISNISNEYEKMIEELNSQYNTDISDIASKYEKELDSVYSEIETLNKKQITLEEINEQRSLTIEKQNDIAKMKTNSNIYNTISDAETKARLHAENLAIAEKWGLQYNPASGNYYDGDSIAYKTTIQETGQKTPNVGNVSNISWDNNVDYQQKIIDSIKSGASGSTINRLNEQRNAKISATGKTPTVSYDKNTDYQALINQAKEQGASHQVIDNLNAQRNAKIAGEGLTQYKPKSSTSKSSTSKSSTSKSSKSSTSNIKGDLTSPSNLRAMGYL